ncbi:MAG: helix-turn-helix domain-containing protein [Schleiferilactobacillus harbinensis]
MSAEDRVLTLIRDQGGPQTTQMVAAQLHLSRSVTSHYLNRLADQGLLVKNDERPVQCRLATNATE